MKISDMGFCISMFFVNVTEKCVEYVINESLQFHQLFGNVT